MSRQVRIEDDVADMVDTYRAGTGVSFAAAVNEVLRDGLSDDDTDVDDEPEVEQPRQTAARIGRTHRRLGRRQLNQ